MLVLGQAASTSASSAAGRCRSSSSSSASLSSSKLIHPKTTLFSKRTTKFSPLNPRKLRHSVVPVASAKLNEGVDSPSSSIVEQPMMVSGDSVPLEGVIQFEKPNSSSRVEKWGRISLLAGGDVLALVLFSAVGRFSHGFSVFDLETLKTADPFVAGWFLGAYFLGGFDEDGRGMNGMSKAISAAAKSWAAGIIIGLGIRALTLGHLPPLSFSLVSVGSTGVLLIGWRALLFSVISSDKGKKDDVYKKGSPFELFENLDVHSGKNMVYGHVMKEKSTYLTTLGYSATSKTSTSSSTSTARILELEARLEQQEKEARESNEKHEQELTSRFEAQQLEIEELKRKQHEELDTIKKSQKDQLEALEKRQHEMDALLGYILRKQGSELPNK